MSHSSMEAQHGELLELFRTELSEVSRHWELPADNFSSAEYTELLNESIQLCEQLDAAMGLSGLTGLAAVCRWLRDNFTAFRKEHELPDSHLVHLAPWARHLSACLQVNETERTFANQNLIAFLSQSQWPLELNEKAGQKLLEKLSQWNLDYDDDGHALPEQLSPEMLSLQVPQDVRPELWEGLLLELPEQVQSFERAVSAYMDSAALHDLAPAQRIAHTIKGAANVVGVAGIANLMHYSEDLLELTAHHGEGPAGFARVLSEVADALACAADYLAGHGPAPDNLLAVLELVVNSIRELKAPAPAAASDEHAAVEFDLSELESLAGFDQIEEEPERYESAREEASSQAPPLSASMSFTAESAIPPASDPPLAATESRLYLPDATAQHLLQLAGESQITNSQIAAQVAAMRSSIQLSGRYHKQITAMAAHLEALVQTQAGLNQAAEGDKGQLDPLELERYSELHSFSHQLLELATDAFEGVSHLAHQLGEIDNLTYGQHLLNQESQDLLLGLRLVPVKSLESRFARCVRQTARLTGKEARLELRGGDLLMDNAVLSRIADPIMHLLRNAVDHGLESSAQRRQAAGKSPEGLIRLSFSQSGEMITIHCEDDGTGLDYHAVKAKAEDLGLLEFDLEADENLLNQVIFLPGFSTREQVSQTSGRGIGLDVVQADIHRIRGRIGISSLSGQGCCFEITVPASILTANTLIVRNDGDRGESTLAVVTHNIEQIVHLTGHEGSRTEYVDETGEQLPLVALNDLTNIHSSTQDTYRTLMLVKKPDGHRVAIAVPGISSCHTLVVKPLNRFCHRTDGVIGATVTGDGTVAPVIDLQSLPGMSLSQTDMGLLRQQRAAMAARANEAAEAPAVLIVDDSLSVRRALAQFVTDIGMQAFTAKDGFEAISAMNERLPALLLVDLEMPRMNGLELTSHLRANESTRHIPVVMVTSRSSEKHRKLARTAGVDGYLNKPWSDEDLLSTIRQHMAEPQKDPASQAHARVR